MNALLMMFTISVPSASSLLIYVKLGAPLSLDPHEGSGLDKGNLVLLQ